MRKAKTHEVLKITKAIVKPKQIVSVLIGEQHGFFDILKKDCPDVMTIHYIGHRLELSLETASGPGSAIKSSRVCKSCYAFSTRKVH